MQIIFSIDEFDDNLDFIIFRSRQDIFKNALKTGWVRVKSHSFGEKHALWKKLFLIFCPEELYLMKSQEVQYYLLFYESISMY